MSNKVRFRIVAIVAVIVAIMFAVVAILLITISNNKQNEIRNVSLEEIMPEENTEKISGEVNNEITESKDSLETETIDSLYSSEEIKECIYNAIYQKAQGNETEVEFAINQLAEMDEDRAEDVRDIFAYWDKTNESGYVNVSGNVEGFPEDNSLLIAVMGYQLNSDGSMKEELIGRLTVAKNLADKYPDSYILVTGGGTASANREATEAGQMAKWLVKEGIDENRIIVEDNSKDTADNSSFSYEIIRRDYPSISKTVIVTSDFHISMAGLFFEAQYILDDNKIEVIGNVPYDTNFRYTFTDEEKSYFLKRLIGNQKWN